jgi:hypothetical protein
MTTFKLLLISLFAEIQWSLDDAKRPLYNNAARSANHQAPVCCTKTAVTPPKSIDRRKGNSASSLWNISTNHSSAEESISHNAKRTKRSYLGRLCGGGSQKPISALQLADRNISLDTGRRKLGHRHGVAVLMLCGSFCICGLSHTDICMLHNIPVFPQH